MMSKVTLKGIILKNKKRMGKRKKDCKNYAKNFKKRYFLPTEKPWRL